MNLHLKFDQTEELTLDFFKSFIYSKRKLFFAIAGFALLMLLINAMYEDFSVSNLISWLLPIAMILGIMMIILPWIMKRQVRHTLKSTNLGTEREMTISEEEIFVKTKATESSFKWDAIVKSGESKLSYFLYIAKNQALIVPKASLTKEEEGQFLELLRGKGMR